MTGLSGPSWQIHEDSTVKESIAWRQRFTTIVSSARNSPHKSLDSSPPRAVPRPRPAQSAAPLPEAHRDSTPSAVPQDNPIEAPVLSPNRCEILHHPR